MDAIRRAARGLIFAAPGGLVRIDPQNQHTWKVSRIGKVQRDGQFKIVWSSEDPLPPRPFLPDTFLATAGKHGKIMFTSISTMIDLETAEPADRQRKQLLAAMADVRGYLGNAHTEFRSAVLVTQQQNRVSFEQAWNELERRWGTLSDKQNLLTVKQRESFERFDEARAAFGGNADAMRAALYQATHTSSEVTP